MGFFLWLSDLHLDPLYGTQDASGHKNGDACKLPSNGTLRDYPQGRFGCDSPMTLLESSLESVKENSLQDNPIQFVLVTGDFARHSTQFIHDIDDPIDFVESILSTCIGTIQSHLPGVSIVPVLGNNDLVPDYYLDTAIQNGNATNTLLEMAHDGFQDSFESDEEAQTFARGGYFSRVIKVSPTSSILVLSLNTIVYSVKHEPEPTIEAENKDDPLGQFEWIEAQLERAATPGAKIASVYIAGHIPPAIGSYRHSQLWHSRYVDRYVSILRAHNGSQKSTPILGHFFGHVHTEEFRVLAYNDETGISMEDRTSVKDLILPLLVTSSLTPIYGSNPSYRIVEYEENSGALLDYSTVYLDLGNPDGSNISWSRMLGFTETYGVPNLSSSSLESLLTNLEEEWDGFSRNTTAPTPLWETFWNRQKVYSPVVDDGDDSTKTKGDRMKDWLCTLRAISRDHYSSCLEGFDEKSQTKASDTESVVLYLILSSIAMIVGVLGVVLGMRSRKRARRKYHRPREEQDGIVTIDNETHSQGISMVTIQNDHLEGEWT